MTSGAMEVSRVRLLFFFLLRERGVVVVVVVFFFELDFFRAFG